MIPAAVLTISDSSYKGVRPDISGPKVADRLSRQGFTVTHTLILPDEQTQIADALRQLADSGTVKAIFTTGGTGITPRDITPEATREVIDREIPGLAELMRLKGRESTPFAVLSRAIVGNRKGVLIINLPGSPQGAVESLDAILDLVPHVLDLINGHTGH